jgi:hypothetical protein
MFDLGLIWSIRNLHWRRLQYKGFDVSESPFEAETWSLFDRFRAADAQVHLFLRVISGRTLPTWVS